MYAVGLHRAPGWACAVARRRRLSPCAGWLQRLAVLAHVEPLPRLGVQEGWQGKGCAHRKQRAQHTVMWVFLSIGAFGRISHDAGSRCMRHGSICGVVIVVAGSVASNMRCTHLRPS